MCECFTFCSTNISVCSHVRHRSRRKGRWEIGGLRSWRRHCSCLPALPPPAPLPGSSRCGTDLSRSWRREVVFPLSLLRRFTMDLCTKRATGIIVLVALLISRMTAEGEPIFPHFHLFIFLLPEETAGVRSAQTRRGSRLPGHSGTLGSVVFRSTFRQFQILSC